jgi:predicted nuclease of predicted toxin-antitoxin system
MLRRILLDESVPAGLRRFLTGFEVKTAPEMGWAGMSNGRLLDEAERAGFEVLVTADSNIRAQQRLAGRRIALVVLTTNHWDTIKADPSGVVTACAGAGQGSYTVIPFSLPLRRQRPRPASP